MQYLLFEVGQNSMYRHILTRTQPQVQVGLLASNQQIIPQNLIPECFMRSQHKYPEVPIQSVDIYMPYGPIFVNH